MGRGSRTIDFAPKRSALRNTQLATDYSNQLAALWGMPDPANTFDKRNWSDTHGEYGEYPWAESFKTSQANCFKPEIWRQALHNFEAAGFRVEIPEQNLLSNEKPNPHRDDFLSLLQVNGEIYRGKKYIGDFDIHIVNYVDDKPEIRLAHVNIRGQSKALNHGDKFLGRGFGKEFVEHLEQTAKENSIERITTHAVGVGCYAWARMGFEIDPRHDVVYNLRKEDFSCSKDFNKAVLESMKSKILFRIKESEALSQKDKEKITEDLVTKDFRDLAELSSYGENFKTSKGKVFPIAKNFMPGIEWCGVKFID